MAARLKKHHQDDVRAKIQASQLVNVLQKHALDPESDEISSSRMKAIEILLRKSVPDLASTEMSLSGDMRVTTVQHEIVDPKDPDPKGL